MSADASAKRRRYQRERLREQTSSELARRRRHAGRGPRREWTAPDWCQRYYRIRRRDRWRPISYVADIMRVVSREADRPRVVSLWKGSQLGFTESGCALAGFLVGVRAQRCVVAMPTDKEAVKWHRRLSKPMLETVPRLRTMLAARADKRSGSGLHVEFEDGAQLLVQGTRTADRYASFVCDFLLLDELDRYAILEEGDPLYLATRAVRNTGGVVLAGSTPTSAYGPSQIVEQHHQADVQFVFAVPCPLCAELDVLEWERVKWDEEGTRSERAATARHRCSSCGGEWPWERLPRALRAGRWIEAEIGAADEFPRPLPDGRHVGADGALVRDAAPEPWPDAAGFALWSGYSSWPSYSWADMVEEWLKAQGSEKRLRVFVEQTLARCWRDKGGHVEVDDLEKHALERLSDLEDGQRLVIVAVDVQQAGFLSALVTAWGPDGRCAIVAREEFVGDVERVPGSAWQMLREWLRGRTWENRRMRVLVVDTGYAPDTTIQNMARVPAERAFAVKGMGGWDRPTYAPGKTMSSGIQRPVLVVGVDPIKSEVAKALAEGRMRVLGDLLPEIGDELTAERLKMRVKDGRPMPFWRQEKERNEAFDCLVYSRSVFEAARVADIDKLPLGPPRQPRSRVKRTRIVI